MVPSGLRGRFVKRPYGEVVGLYDSTIHNNIMVNQKTTKKPPPSFDGSGFWQT